MSNRAPRSDFSRRAPTGDPRIIPLPRRGRKRTLMIYVLLADGFEEIEALTPVDMLRRTGLPVRTVGITGKVVTGAHGIQVVADIFPQEMQEVPAALLVLPGGMPGAKNLDEWVGMDDLLKTTLTEGGRIAAICAAPMILGKRGYLRDRYAACYPGFEKYLTGAKPAEGRVITDGPFTTAVGMGAAHEFACELVSCLCGIDAAAQLYTDTQGK